jgi:hypothetical protein
LHLEQSMGIRGSTTGHAPSSRKFYRDARVPTGDPSSEPKGRSEPTSSVSGLSSSDASGENGNEASKSRSKAAVLRSQSQPLLSNGVSKGEERNSNGMTRREVLADTLTDLGLHPMWGANKPEKKKETRGGKALRGKGCSDGSEDNKHPS